jgi:chromosome segregation ATPase
VLGFNFSNTITIGAVIVGILVLGLYALTTLKDRDTKRWRDLYELASAERKELQGKLDEMQKSLDSCVSELAKAREIIVKLDALQMPIKIVELMNESVVRIDNHAQERLAIALTELRNEASSREVREEQRHDALLQALGELKEAIHMMGKTRTSEV